MDESRQVIRDAVGPEPSMAPEVSSEPVVVVALPEAARRMYVKKEDLRRYGYSPGCPGCNSIRSGSTQVGHNDVCRRRIVDGVSQIDDGRKRIAAARGREEQYLTRPLHTGRG